MCSSISEISIYTPPYHQGTENIMEEGVERMQELEDVADRCEMLSSSCCTWTHNDCGCLQKTCTISQQLIPV